MVNRSPIKDVMVAILIVTLAFSVAAVANPLYFVRNAAAESHEENPSEDSTSEEQYQESEQESIDEVLGENSEVDIELDEDTEVEVEIQEGDLADGQYTITFKCTEPEFSATFPHTLDVVAGEGQLEYDLTLEAGTYSGCVLSTGELSVAFPQFTIVVEQDDEEEADGTEEENSGEQHEEESQVSEEVENVVIEQDLGENSEVEFQPEEEGAEVEVDIVEGDLVDGMHVVTFACASPEFSFTFAHKLNVEGGNGDFKAELTLPAGTYTGCMMSVSSLSVRLPEFTIVADEEHDHETHKDAEEKSNEDARGEEEHEANDEGERRSNDETAANTEEEQHDDDKRTIEEKQNDRRQFLVEKIVTHEIHQRHINAAKASSSGDYQPGLPLTLTAAGTAEMREGEATNAEMEIDIAVWKSNRAIILMDVIDGTITVGEDSYTIRLGYALYSLHHDVLRVRALVTDDATGEILRLHIQGDATIDEATFPMVEGEAMELQFEGNHERFANQVGSWELSLDGSVEA